MRRIVYKLGRDLAKKVGVESSIFISPQAKAISSSSSMLPTAIISPNSRWHIHSQGNVRSRTSRAWSEAELLKLVSELP